MYSVTVHGFEKLQLNRIYESITNEELASRDAKGQVDRFTSCSELCTHRKRTHKYTL